jgi:cytochrome P450
MLYLMTNVVVYNKLQAEIDAGVRDGRISTPITFDEAKRLPYLQAVLLESMRMHPGISANFLKTVPPEGDVLLGQEVPGGTYIAMNLWSLLRRKDLFGEDADTFRPERWMDDYSGTKTTAEGEAKRAEMAKAVDLNFGYGRYSCAGKTIALKELNKIFVEVCLRLNCAFYFPSSFFLDEC